MLKGKTPHADVDPYPVRVTVLICYIFTQGAKLDNWTHVCVCFVKNFMRAHSVTSSSATWQCVNCLFHTDLWPVYDLVSLILTCNVCFNSFENVKHGANKCFTVPCKWISLLQLNDFCLFLHMFIVHGCSILIKFYFRIMLIGLNMRIKATRFLVPLSQRGDLCLQSGNRRRYIICFISLLLF